jgi:predicted nuclease with TOPRIM domain
MQMHVGELTGVCYFQFYYYFSGMDLNTIIQTIIAFIVGGGITAIITLRSTKKKSDADALKSIQEVYNSFLEDFKEQANHMRGEIKELKEFNSNIQKQFNELHLNYSKEVEISQNWEKLHRQIKDKYDDLERAYEILKKDHYQLKRAFESYKKTHK